jgi:hypothetical protein
VFRASFNHTIKDAGVFTDQQAATVSETVSENTERVVKNSGGLCQIVLDYQRENPYLPRI